MGLLESLLGLGTLGFRFLNNVGMACELKFLISSQFLEHNRKLYYGFQRFHFIFRTHFLPRNLSLGNEKSVIPSAQEQFL
uniref:Uncharacterized protein n=1 Tax=Lepeophtheirus salmonis TaxID=72036 RepID=A0A0K2UR74_LEPSM